MSQYGGINQAADRYKELLKLPEAELAKGVSIDGYSTYPGHPVFGAGLTSEFGALFVVLGAAYFSVQGQRGRFWKNQIFFYGEDREEVGRR